MRGARVWPLRATSSIVLVVGLLATGAASWGTYAVVHDQEQRLLKERANELNLLLTSSLQAIQSTLSAQGGILRATDGSASAFEQAAAPVVAADTAKPTLAWLRKTPGGYVVAASVGDGLQRREVVTGVRAQTFDAAMRAPNMLDTPLFDPDRKLGFALGPPLAPAGTVVYRQTELGPVRPPRAASSAPYAELDVAIYGGRVAVPATLLLATTKDVPLQGDVRSEPLVTGNVHWLVSAKAKTPLVGNIAANAWWLAAIVGVLGSILLAAVFETNRRRRDAALALYDSEHQVAETLQRSLLPQLPALAGLDVAARYLPGSKGQEVGGDWFDVFPVAGDAVAVTVGDVIGHDLAAASAMAQIRAAVRAYAIDGDEPRTVINRLDRLVDALGLTPLATVVYGVLSPADADGSRTFTYTNAGHPLPLLRRVSGEVVSLEGVQSVLIGAPIDVDHLQTSQRIDTGETLLLFTDGLIEEPGRSLDEALARLADAFAEHGSAADLDDVCQHVLATTADRELRDDVAVLAIRIGVGGGGSLTPAGRQTVPDLQI